MKASEIMPLHIAYAPMEQTDELNKALNILAKLHVRCGEYEFTLSVETVFMSANATKLIAAISDPKSKYSCRQAHAISFLESSTDFRK